MGWWSKAIMGGDAPWDAEGDTLDFLGFDTDHGLGGWEECPDVLRQMLELKSDQDWVGLLTQKNYNILSPNIEDRETPYIKAQVIAYLHMESGAVLPPSIRKWAIEACEEELWGKNNAERRYYLDAFVDQINNYDGTPTQTLNEGYTEKMIALMEKEEKKKRSPKMK